MFNRLKSTIDLVSKNPIHFFTLLNLTRIKNLIYLIFKADKEEFKRVLLHYNQTSSVIKPECDKHVLTKKNIEAKSDGVIVKGYEDPEKVSEPPSLNKLKSQLVLPTFENIEVSIIIPVYNQWEMTLNCIRSIEETVSDIAYEIILADDCSNDDTQLASELITNVVHIKTPQNQGFLLNCNNAAGYAKGEYLVFLNNDTLVHDNWLNSLLVTIKNDKKIAIVGSKLVYSDGKLQEAGGIVFSDASGWNYGRLDDPTKPEYNYVKEVDYISGASILVSTYFWRQVNGFDARYIPAYYEDTDLAFQARDMGYKVVYQPNSVVTHFEGQSNGVDESSGIKAYQAVNKDKFYQKWQSTLSKNHSSNSAELFIARDRGQDKKTILVIDHYVPWFDKDAGSRSTFMYLSSLVKEGYNVKFLGDNFFPHQPYTNILQNMGIEVIYGNYYASNWRGWLEENGHSIDVFFLHRPHIASKYIDFIKSNFTGKVLYQCHDLHFMRLRKGFEISGDKKMLKESEYWYPIEKALFEKADIGLTFSCDEKSYIEEHWSGVNVEQVPLFLYNESAPEGSSFEERQGLLFVGGFSHQPNVDAIEWFLEKIWPDVKNSLPDVEFYVAGGGLPEKIKQKSYPGVHFLGYVPDDELEKLYLTARLVVLPLRYGAGVKGKLVESAYYSTPVIVTSVSLEGIKSNLVSRNTSAEFIKETIEVYNCKDHWLANKKELNNIAKQFYETRFNKLVRIIF